MKKVFLTLVIIVAMATSSFNAKAANIGPCVEFAIICGDGNAGIGLLCGSHEEMVEQYTFFANDICGWNL